MKKQIAVLMAAATAVTTVAPALAHADTTEAVSANIVAKAKAALEEKYAEKDANGYTVPTESALSKDYLNSRNIVLVKISGDTVKQNEVSKYMSKVGLDSLADSAYNSVELSRLVQVKVADDKYITPASKEATQYYVVDSISKLENVLERYQDDATVTIVKKGVYAENKGYTTTKSKYYVSNSSISNDNTSQVSLLSAVQDLYNITRTAKKYNKKPYIKKVSVETQTYNGGVYTVDSNTYKDIVSTVGEDDQAKPQYDEAKYKKLVDALSSSNTTIRNIHVEFANDDYELDLKANDLALDFTATYKKTDKNESLIKLFVRDANSDTGFAPVTEGDNTMNVLKDINYIKPIENGSGDIRIAPVDEFKQDEYKVLDQTPEALELKNIYTREGGYTQEGADFVNSIINARKGNNGYSFNFRGVTYILDGEIGFNKAKIDTADKGYVLIFNAHVKNANDLSLRYNLRFEIYGDAQKDLYDVLRDLQGTVEVVPGHFTKLAGTNRFATAIAVSQEQFKPETADSVVIVGGYAQMDGLAAAPLASAKNAPILLADPKTGLSNDTLNEIKRACKSLKNRTVYIVGGPHSVPMSVEKQLEKEFGAVVVRSYGVDRNATSLAVAKRLFWDGQTNGRVFIVGRDGGADAMGVASVASYGYDQLHLDRAKQLAAQKVAQELVNRKTLNDKEAENVKSKTELAYDILKDLTNDGTKVEKDNADTIKTRYVKEGNNYAVLDATGKIVDVRALAEVVGLEPKELQELINAIAVAKTTLNNSSYDVAKGEAAKIKLANLTIERDSLKNYLDAKANIEAFNTAVKTIYKDEMKKEMKKELDPAAGEVYALKVVKSIMPEVQNADMEKVKTAISDDKTGGKLDVTKLSTYINGKTTLLGIFGAVKSTSEGTLTETQKKLYALTLLEMQQQDLEKLVNAAKYYFNADGTKNDNDVAEALTGKTLTNFEEADVNKITQAIDTLTAANGEYAKYITEKNNYDKAMTTLKTLVKKLSNDVAVANAQANKYYEFKDLFDSVKGNIEQFEKLNGRTVSPIIVVNKNSVDRSTREFIKFALNSPNLPFDSYKTSQGDVYRGLKAYIIGGENSVSSRVREDLIKSETISKGNLVRLSGKDRYETNVRVINNFYNNGKKYVEKDGTLTPNELIRVKGAVFTSGDDKYLVDSQTAGFFAASKNAPIVLTGNALSSNQVDMMKKDGVLYEQRSGIYQVGGVVSADVMKNVVQLLGL